MNNGSWELLGIPATEAKTCQDHTITTDITIYPSMEACFDLPLGNIICGDVKAKTRLLCLNICSRSAQLH